jgi:hypothetical protein
MSVLILKDLKLSPLKKNVTA